MRTITRGDVALTVVEAPDRDLWDFWGLYERGEWEPALFDVLDRLLTPAGTYVDLGAWIGPTVLYAARRCARVIAVEPDPAALDQLNRNLDLNQAGNVTVVAAAVDVVDGDMLLFTTGRWGDSMSSTARPRGQAVTVPAVTPAALLKGLWQVDLVKVDIEGAEQVVLPALVPLLEERRTPCLVSLHEAWFTRAGAEAVSDALACFSKVSVLPDEAPVAFRTVLCEWG